MQNSSSTHVSPRTASDDTHKKIRVVLMAKHLQAGEARENHLLCLAQDGVAQPRFFTKPPAKQLYFFCRYPDASRLTHFLGQHNIPLDQALMALKVSATFGYDENMKAIMQHYAPDMDIGNLKADTDLTDQRVIATLSGWFTNMGLEQNSLPSLLAYMAVSDLLQSPSHLDDMTITDKEAQVMELNQHPQPALLLIRQHSDKLASYLDTKRGQFGEGSDEYKLLIQMSLSHACEAGLDYAFLIITRRMPPSLVLNTPLDRRGNTALMIAARHGHQSIIDRLLHDTTIDINQSTRDGRTALTTAASGGHTDIALALIEAGVTVTNNDLAGAANSGCVALIQPLLQQPGVDINHISRDNCTALYRAARGGHTEFVLALIEAGANATSNDLRGAAECGCVALIQPLLQQPGVDINHASNNRSTALYHAAQGGHTKFALALIEEGAHATSHDLCGAARSGSLELVNALLLPGMQVNDTPGTSNALSAAAFEGHTDIVHALILAGANVDSPDGSDITAVSMAATAGHTDIVRALIQAGADVNIPDDDGDTALIMAAFRGHTDIVHALLQAGANPNHRADNGVTPLSGALSEGYPECAEAIQQKLDELNSTNSDLPSAPAHRPGAGA